MPYILDNKSWQCNLQVTLLQRWQSSTVKHQLDAQKTAYRLDQGRGSQSIEIIFATESTEEHGKIKSIII